VIVWLASFPRSGNTFLRIVVHRLYGVRTSTVYDVDGVAQRLGAGLVGFEEREATFEDMRASDQVHFVKTHRPRDEDVDAADQALCLVRDGRDALVSWARQRSEGDTRGYEDELRTLIGMPHTRGAGRWGHNVSSWLEPGVPGRVVLRFEELVHAPRDAVTGAMALVLPGMTPAGDAAIPSFADLRAVDDRFFRRGISGAHRDELPEELHKAFWAQPDNRAAMNLLGYD
jgi:hypothetical protein